MSTPSNFSISEGFSVFGKLSTYFGTFFATIICLVFLYFGYSLITSTDVYKETIDATIIKTDCKFIQPTDSRSSGSFNCLLDLKYSIMDKEYTQQISTTSSSVYVVGNLVKIKYNPSNPLDIKTDGLSNKASGWIMVIVSLIVLTIVWIWTYNVATNPSFSSVVGGFNAINMLTRR